jgi:hypothetical protein
MVWGGFMKLTNIWLFLLSLVFTQTLVAQVLAQEPDLAWLDLEIAKIGIVIVEEYSVGDTLIVFATGINEGTAEAPFGFAWTVNLFAPNGAQILSNRFGGQQPMAVGERKPFTHNTGFIFQNPGNYTLEVVFSDVVGEVNLDNNSRSRIVTVRNPVDIDVKPGNIKNQINICSSASIRVAILGSETFDATDVDATTVKFADADVRRRGNSEPKGQVQDVNQDKITDFVLKFNVAELKLNSGDTQAELRETLSGIKFNGTDSVKIKQQMCIRTAD